MENNDSTDFGIFLFKNSKSKVSTKILADGTYASEINDESYHVVRWIKDFD